MSTRVIRCKRKIKVSFELFFLGEKRCLVRLYVVRPVRNLSFFLQKRNLPDRSARLPICLHFPVLTIYADLSACMRVHSVSNPATHTPTTSVISPSDSRDHRTTEVKSLGDFEKNPPDLGTSLVFPWVLSDLGVSLLWVFPSWRMFRLPTLNEGRKREVFRFFLRSLLLWEGRRG